MIDQEIIDKINTLPSKLYKYRGCSNEYHIKMIEENQIFFSSAALLNDPFDSTIPLRFDKLSNHDWEKLYFEKSKQNHPQLNRAQRKNLSKEVVAKAQYKKDVMISEYKKFQLEKNRTDFGIFSLSEEKDNIIMWSHYSESHKGFCVGFNVKKLYEYLIKICLSSRGEEVFDIFKVEYEEFYPILIPSKLSSMEFVIKPLITKSDKWIYENEFRILLIGKTNTILVLPENIIEEVILGCNINSEDRNGIVEILKSKNENIKLFQSKISEEKYSLEFDEISYKN